MNRIFRIIWSKALRTWVVASEFAMRNGKGNGGAEVDERGEEASLRHGHSGGLPMRACAVAVLLALYTPAWAADVYWDFNGFNPSTMGGTGTWDLTSQSWDYGAVHNGTTGPYRAWNNAALDDAFFQGTAGTVTLAQPITAHKAGTVNWLGTPPKRVPPGEPRPPGSIYHFLVPDEGMSPYESDKVVAALCPKEIAALKAWRKTICQPFTPMEVKRLQTISATIDELWEEHRRIREQALDRVRQPIHLWGQPAPTNPRWKTVEECEPIAREIFKKGSPGARLKAVMDHWCSLWSWPVERVKDLPYREAWLEHIESLLERGATAEQVKIDEQRFLHWELEFPEAFTTTKGGFDVVLGNPPWLKLDWNEVGILADIEPLLAVRKMNAKQVSDKRTELLARAPALRLYTSELCETFGIQGFLSSAANFPNINGARTNFYKCFLERALTLTANAFGFLHQPGLFDDSSGGRLRAALYYRMRLAARFLNELRLFPEINNQRPYALSVYGARMPTPSFQAASSILHPITLEGSQEHDGAGPTPAMKDEAGNWDLRPHRCRLVPVTETTLALFASLYDEPGTPALEARLPVIHSQEVLSALTRFAEVPRRLSDLGESYFCTEHFNETNQMKDGTIKRDTKFPKTISDWVVSGPHFFVGNPFSKTPNEGCHHNKDYTTIDLSEISEDYLPRTNYLPGCAKADYLERTPRWKSVPTTSFFRHARRTMIAPTGERTIIPVILPPGPAHIHGVSSISFSDEKELIGYTGLAQAIPVDFLVKSTGSANLHPTLADRLPLPNAPYVPLVCIRTLQLNCLTSHYADLWDRNLPKKKDLLPSAKSADPRCAGWEKVPRTWTWHAPLRTPFARRQALVELDALAALSLHMTLDELQLIYRVQFPVLQQYERETYYDRRGKIVFTVNKGLSGVGLDRKSWEIIKDAKKGERLPEWAVDAGGPYEPPFDRCDREEDMAQAYAYFKDHLGDA